MQGKAAFQPGHRIIGRQRNRRIIGRQCLSQPALTAQRQPQRRQQPRIFGRQCQPAPNQCLAVHRLACFDIGPGDKVPRKRIGRSRRQRHARQRYSRSDITRGKRGIDLGGAVHAV